MARPISDFHGLYGQPRPVARARHLNPCAKSCGEPAPPIMVSGRSGIGNTLSAVAMAKESGVELHTVIAAKSVTPMKREEIIHG